ncbi:hypothetical protein [Salirhabdus sp. Marseille-P4669]|uniref:hypothetical protein n=1 Tax=Salirhabdus sp. Marseille-P4669 TaxID=2042310 RepID=UPI0013589FE0|nr:hypothetical protein [Salirhabdus sp. Marseille-P4669]
MLFESTYRRQAMNRLQEENKQLKETLSTQVKMEKNRTKNPVTYFIMVIVGWFTQ